MFELGQTQFFDLVEPERRTEVGGCYLAVTGLDIPAGAHEHDRPRLQLSGDDLCAQCWVDQLKGPPFL